MISVTPPSKKFTQGEADWLAWRREGLGSSDSAVVMLASKWCTPVKLWELKLGLREEDPPNWAMNRGKIYEPHARAAFELEHDADMPPDCVENDKYPFIRASLDGWNRETNRLLEIKIPGKVDHALAAKGEIPEKYKWQLDHQMICTGSPVADYWSYHPESKTGFRVEYRADLERQKRLFAAEVQFWELVKTKTKPEKITWLGPLT
jgi:putative phage-type endonuclease